MEIMFLEDSNISEISESGNCSNENISKDLGDLNCSEKASNDPYNSDSFVEVESNANEDNVSILLSHFLNSSSYAKKCPFRDFFAFYISEIYPIISLDELKISRILMFVSLVWSWRSKNNTRLQKEENRF